jgi:serine/threonine protein kinase
MVASWEKEGAVLRDMNKLKQIHIVPFLTAFRHGHQGNEDHYLMFEWASGGNLRQLWSDLKRERLSSGIVKAALKQLLGLSEAIYNAHEPSMAAEASERSKMFAKDGLRGDFFRHGDLKPENILWFKDEEHDNETGFNMGTLKIGDWGLAKRQNIPTQLRTHRTTTEFGTCRYEPPEEITGLTVNLPDNTKRRSRLYDIWGMGCIFLEFLIWLLYGTEGLKKFNHSMITKQNTCPPFYEVVERDGKPHGVVHPSVVKWMDHIANDPACNGDGTALGDLLKVIREDLLVVDLPEKLGSHISETEQAALNSWAQTTTDQDDLQAADSNDVPQITVNEDRSTTSQDNQKPTSNMVMRRKKPRARARQFYLRMEGIVDLDYNGEEYWLPAEPGPPLSLQVCSHDKGKELLNIPLEGSTVLDTVPRNDSELLSLASPKGLVTIRVSI